MNPKAAQAARNASARAGSSGGVSQRRFERVSRANARAPAQKEGGKLFIIQGHANLDLG